MFSQTDAQLLSTARMTLREYERMADRAASPTGGADYSPKDCGRFAEACHAAEQAIFEAMNVSANYLDDHNAADELARTWGK
jgi:hypothetical protein